MNKLQLIIDAVLLGAVIALFVLVFQRPATEVAVTEEGVVVATTEQLPVAYLNLDSLLQQYTFAIEANDKLMTKQENARVKLNERAKKLQSDMADFQKKLDNNAFLSRERAESEAQRIQKQQQDLQELEARLTQDIMEENAKLNMQLKDTLDNYLKIYNANGKYQIIFANTQSDNVLCAQPGYDITGEVVAGLNKRYSKK